MPRRFSRVGAIAAVLVMGLVTPATFGAASSRPVIVLSRVETVRAEIPDAAADPWLRFGNPAMVEDSSGSATLAWQENQQLLVSDREPGGSWSVPQVLGSTQESFGVVPQLAVDAAGTVTAVWDESSVEYGRRRVMVADRVRGGAWSVPTLLTGKPLLRSAGNPSVTAAANGTVLVTLEGFHGSNSRLAAFLKPPGQSWSQVQPFIVETGYENAALLADNGSGLLVTRVGVRKEELGAFRYRPGRGWNQHPTRFGRWSAFSGFGAAMNAAGRAVVAWEVLDDDAWGTDMMARVMTRTGNWRRAHKISGRGEGMGPPQVTLDSRDVATVLWSYGTERGRILMSTRRPQLGWSAPTSLTPKMSEVYLEHAQTNATGHVAVTLAQTTYSIPQDSPSRLWLLLRNPAGVWSAPKLVATSQFMFPDDENASVASATHVRADGTAALVYTVEGPAGRELRFQTAALP
jgi:hypothetical protein